MTDRTDDELFEAFRSDGDARALAELFDASAPGLLRLARHVTTCDSDAEDLVQETFLAAIEARAAYRSGENRVRAWLAGILQNRAKRLRRYRAKRRADELQDDAVIDGEAAADRAAMQEVSTRVSAAVERMHEPYRTVLRLHIQTGLAVPEIANRLTRSQNTVRSQLMRGLDRLRQSLPKEWAAAGGVLFSTGGLDRIREAVLERATDGAAAGTVGLATVGAMKARFAWAAAVLLLMGGAWWRWSTEGAAGPLGAEQSAAGVTPSAAADPQSPGIGEGSIRVAAQPSSPAELLDPVVVTVLDDGTGMPVAGAELWFITPDFRAVDLPPDEHAASFDLRLLDDEEFGRRYGVQRFTGSDGTVKVERRWASQGFTARFQDRYGRCTDMLEHEVRIAPDRSRSIRVVEADGSPAVGVCLRLLAMNDAGNAMIWGGEPQGIGAWADEAGLATLRHVDEFERRLRGMGVANWTLTGPDRQGQITLPVGEWPDPDQPLRMQPFGQVRVEVVDVRGQTLPAVQANSVMVELRSAGRGMFFEDVIDGVAHFSRIPVGGSLDLELWSQVAGAQKTFDGPRFPGDVVDLRVVAGLDSVACYGRIVDGDGAPLGGVELSVDGQMRLRSEPDGAVRFYVDPVVEGGDPEVIVQSLEVEWQACGHEERSRNGLRSARVGVPDVIAGSSVDLGDLVMRTAPQLARGRFTIEPRGSWDRVRRSLEFSVVEEATGEEVDGAVVQLDEDGQLAVHGRTRSAGPFMLVTEQDGFGWECVCMPTESLKFDRGDLDLELRIQVGGELQLRFAAAPHNVGVTNDNLNDRVRSLRIWVEPLDGQWPEYDTRTERAIDVNAWDVRLIDDRRVVNPRVTPLWPGRYRVSVRAPGVSGPLVTLEDLVIHADATHEHPTVIDPWRDFEVFKLRFFDRESSAEISSSGVCVSRSPSRGVATISADESTFLCPHDAEVAVAPMQRRLVLWTPGESDRVWVQSCRRTVLELRDSEGGGVTRDGLRVELRYEDGQEWSSWMSTPIGERLRFDLRPGETFLPAATGRYLATIRSRDGAVLGSESVVIGEDGRCVTSLAR